MEPPEQQARPVQPAYAPQGAYSAPVQRYSPQEAEGCVYGMLQPGAGLGRVVSPYYAREFADIAAGGRGRFNAAAFFLGPFHQLYRGNMTSDEMFAKIGDTLTMLTTGGANRG